MGDIEAMYYQVQVSKEHRSVSRFIWSEDSDLSGDLLYYETCVYVFGRASSPGSYNDALRKRATDNEVVYEEEASQTF